jgi:hypothetical protein
MTKRSQILSELEQTKRALQASEKRGRRSVQRIREIDKLLEPAIPKMETWSHLPVSDEADARGVLTVGMCRALLRLLKPDSVEEPVENLEES